jgi:hypothetical protein
MFWPFLLPMAVTSALMAAMIAAAYYLSPKLRISRPRSVLLALLIVPLVYIPACTGIMYYIIDPMRFGTLEYRDYDSVHSLHVRRYLPEGAKEITARVGAAGFEARFKITAKELEAWKTRIWNRDGNDSVGGFDDTDEIDADLMRQAFGDEPLNPTESWMAFHGPRAGNGGGATIYFCEARGIAYEDAGYW